jgi:hypothetical protein
MNFWDCGLPWSETNHLGILDEFFTIFTPFVANGLPIIRHDTKLDFPKSSETEKIVSEYPQYIQSTIQTINLNAAALQRTISSKAGPPPAPPRLSA